MSADEALVADDRAIEDGGAHANEHFVANGAGVKDGAVTDGDVVAEQAGKIIGQMEDGIVLDVAVVADDDAVDVGSRDGVVPDAGMIAHGDIAQNDSAFRNIHPIAEGRLLVEKSLELSFQFVHGLVLAEWKG